jgi:hypothetical protein
VSFAKFLFLPSWFAKLLEANFSCFAKIIWMPSWFAKLLELVYTEPEGVAAHTWRLSSFATASLLFPTVPCKPKCARLKQGGQPVTAEV